MAATNGIKTAIIASATTTLVIGALSVTAYKWWKVWSFNKKVEGDLKRFGSHEKELDQLVEDATEEVCTSEGGVEPSGRRVWKRMTSRVQRNLAYVVADEAYFQFGRRERSKANDLVVRKYIRDYLRDLKGPVLRAKDASTITELAVSLSYVPPEQYWEIKEAEGTKAYRSRVPTVGPQTV